ncbi:M48 family metallopeptidase [Patescibacteria group bacterium]|nr:M48 family metallopeptidase [Patescibacteria group bacterium]
MRSQKTKRGTCSSNRHISLNRKLITLPDRIIDYVICHELAHLTHMNHSKQFRDHCTSLYPRTKEAKKRMKQEGYMIE